MAERKIFIKDLPALSSVSGLLGKAFEIEGVDGAGKPASYQIASGLLLQAINAYIGGPNNRRDLRKAVTFYSTTQPNYQPGRQALTTLNLDFLCLGCTCTVEFEQDGSYANALYELRYDATGPLSVWSDATFGDNGRVSARWVKVGTPDGLTGRIPAFNALTTRYAAGAQVVSDARVWQTDAELLRASYPDGRIPTPSDAGGPWREISRATPTALHQELGVPLARQLADAEELVPGRLYVLLRGTAGAVHVPALAAATLAPEGFWFNPDSGQLERAAYDLNTDTVSAVVGGGGEARFTITPTESDGGIQAGQTYTNVSSEELWRLKLVRYQFPSFNDSLRIGGQSDQTVEVGTAFPAGFKSFTWSTSNSQNVQANSVTLRDVTANTILAGGEANDGSISASTQAFTAVKGISRVYLISAVNTQGGTFSEDVTIRGAYASYLGASTSPSLTGAQIVALGGAQLQDGRGRSASGITTSGGQYLYYGYEASAGDLTSIIQDGAAPVLGAFQKLGDFPVTNAAGATVTIRLYRSNAVNAFTNNSLAFS